MELNNDYGNEDDLADFMEQEELLDEQDINDGDREVLNDRFLGIIDVFKHFGTQPSNAAQN
jgi:hypothetical protein